jgi:hypothetical protein
MNRVIFGFHKLLFVINATQHLQLQNSYESLPTRNFVPAPACGHWQVARIIRQAKLILIELSPRGFYAFFFYAGNVCGR